MAEMAPCTRQPPSWSEIAPDLASQVLRLLPAQADRVSFAAVCPQWRAAALQLHLPLLALPDDTFYSLPNGKSFCFPGFGCAGYKTAAACGRWLVFPRDDGCFLVNPFARATVTLPPLSRVRLRPPDAVAKYVTVGNVSLFHPHAMHLVDMKKEPIINKLILCSPNLVAAFVGSTLASSGHNSQIQLVCQPGASSWSVRANDECRLFQDMVFYQGKLYAIASEEDLLIVNISQDPNPSTGDPQISWIVQEGCCRMVGKKLVAEQYEFEVFKADLKHSQWVIVTTLGDDDQMLFLGRPCSRAVHALQYGMSGDQIFFLDDVLENAFEEYAFEEENTSASAYAMRTSEVSSPLPMSWNHKMIIAAWLFPWD